MSVIGQGIMLGGKKPLHVAAENDVNFYDYDGTILYSYSAAEFANLSAMPAHPSHDGLVADGFNSSLADAKNYVATYGMANIGFLYQTSNGATRLYFDIPKYVEPYDRVVTIAFRRLSGSVTIDWGDGTSETVSSGNDHTISHTFSETGMHVVKTSTTGGYALRNQFISPMVARSSWLIKAEIGNGLTEMPVFHECRNLQTVTMPGYIRTASYYIFQYCESIKHITLPELTSIQPYDILYSYSLKSISFPCVTSIGSIPDNFASSLSAVSSLLLPEGISTIGNTAFHQMESAKKVVIPVGVTTVGSVAFGSASSLYGLTIPSSVTELKAGSLRRMYSLKELFLRPTTVASAASSDVFANLPTDCRIYVPYSSLAAYLTATNYPAPATYTYIGFATYDSGATLPTQDSTSAYNVTWYASKADAIAQTNPISTGNGAEIYCRYAAA